MELQASNEQLTKKLGEVELLNRTMFGREERILELKEQVRALESQGRTPQS